MTVDQAVDLCRDAFWLSLILGMPIILVSLVVGVLVGIFQAVTQIQEQTLSMVPKLALMVLVIILLLPWLLNHMTDYTHNLFQNIPSYM